MRIVSLLPSGTEIAASLGLMEHIVGVSHECDFPADARNLPVLTRSILDHDLSPSEIDDAVAAASLDRKPLYAVDGELLTKLQPDLILTQGVCAVCAVTPSTIADSLRFVRLENTCTAPVLSLTGTDIVGIQADLRAVAAACGVEDRAEEVINDMNQRWNAIPNGAHRPKVLMLEWPDPPWSAGHWVPEQVHAAGGFDPFGTAGEASRRLTWEDIATADPDIIIASACGFDLQTNLKHIQDSIDNHPEVAALRAVKNKQVWAVDANSHFSRPAPRVVEGAEILARILAGESVAPNQAVQLS